MSIDAQPSHGEKVRRTLMSIDAVRDLAIANYRGRQAPPHSVGQDRQILTCSRSGDRELQGPVSRGRGDRGGQAPALRFGRKLILKILLIL